MLPTTASESKSDTSWRSKSDTSTSCEDAETVDACCGFPCLQRLDRYERCVCATATAWGLTRRLPPGLQPVAIAIWWFARHALYMALLFLALFSGSQLAQLLVGSLFIAGHSWKLTAYTIRLRNAGVQAGRGAAVSPSLAMEKLTLCLDLSRGSSGMGVGFGSGGAVRVVTLLPDSPASAAGVAIGDVILAVGDVQCSGVAHFTKTLRVADGIVPLTVERPASEASAVAATPQTDAVVSIPAEHLAPHVC